MGVILTFFQNLMCCAIFFHGYQRRTHFVARVLTLSTLCAWLLHSINGWLQSPALGLPRSEEPHV